MVECVVECADWCLLFSSELACNLPSIVLSQKGHLSGPKSILSNSSRTSSTTKILLPIDVQEFLRRCFQALSVAHPTQFRPGRQRGMDPFLVSTVRGRSDPCYSTRRWHTDDVGAISLVIPLTDFTLSNGSTQVLLGSHLRDAAKRIDWQALKKEGEVGARFVSLRGCPLLMNSQVLHRARRNDSNKDRVALVTTVDQVSFPTVPENSTGKTREV